MKNTIDRATKDNLLAMGEQLRSFLWGRWTIVPPAEPTAKAIRIWMRQHVRSAYGHRQLFERMEARVGAARMDDWLQNAVIRRPVPESQVTGVRS